MTTQRILLILLVLSSYTGIAQKTLSEMKVKGMVKSIVQVDYLMEENDEGIVTRVDSCKMTFDQRRNTLTKSQCSNCQHISHWEEIERRFFSPRKTDEFPSENGYQFRTFYDSLGRYTRKFYGPMDHIEDSSFSTWEQLYTYQENVHRARIETYSDGILINITKQWRDSLWRITSSEVIYDSEVLKNNQAYQIEDYEYDEFGNKVCSVTRLGMQIIHKQYTRFAYDSIGNWTWKELIRNDSLIRIQRRKYEYYLE